MGIEGKGFLINRTTRETRNAEIGPTDLRQHPQGEDLLPLPRRWVDVSGTRSSRAIPSARRGDLPRRNFLSQPIQGLDLLEVCALAKGRNALGNQLKDNGSEIAEAGKDLGGESHQIEVSLSRVRVYPIAALDLHASQMHFPNALQRKAGHDIADPGTAVLLIDPKVGEIEQYSAIGLFDDGCEEFAIRQFVITKAKVVYSCFEREREIQQGAAFDVVLGGEPHARIRLHGRHQKTTRLEPGPGADMEDTQMLTGPAHAQFAIPHTEFRYV